MIDLLTRARVFYGSLEPARQTQLWLGLVALVAVAVGGWFWMTHEPYATLVQGTPDEIGEAASALREADIPMRTDGNSLSVPESRRGEAAGVLGSHLLGGVARPIKELPMGASPQVIREYFRRQKESDLASSVAAMAGVARARVHLEHGEEGVLAAQDEGARASVLVELVPGAAFGRSQAAAIQRLVAGGVQDLDPADVIVTDKTGQLFAGGPASEMDQLAEIRRGYERDVEKKARTHLLAAVGPHFVVSAQAEIERRSMEMQVRDLDPNRGATIQERVEELTREKATPPAEGAPGVDAETPERAEPARPGGGNDNEERTKLDTTMDYKRTLTTEVVPPGSLTRLAISVSVDEAILSELWGAPPGEPGFDDRLADLERNLEDAVGFDAERGDTLTVVARPFAPVDTVEAPTMTMEGVSATVAPYVPYAIALVALLLAFFFVVRPLMARVTSAPLPRAVALGPDGQPVALPDGGEGGDDLAERLHRLVENFQPVDSEDLNELVAQRPEASAKVLADWARDEN